MFSPVACSQCGKPFQVPEATLGKPTVCPWCQATVPALPIGAPAPAATLPTKEPLSLDDAPIPATATSPVGRKRWFLVGCVGIFALVLAAGVTIAVKRHKQGHVMGWEWQTFAAPDKSCSIELLGKPVEDPDAAGDEKRFISEGSYSGTTTWVGWRDLTQVQVQLAGTKDAFQHFAKPFDAERDRLKLRYGGTVAKDATTKFEDPLTREVRLDFPPGGRLVERMMVFPNGPRPRMYFVGIAGKFEFDSPEVQRFFDSFRVTE
ncbi:MAG: hypothetical protein C0467_26515 [Planctomycetaceae bacterium]|nr:hypothetical protein [Planctomycetaceae bacterium]